MKIKNNKINKMYVVIGRLATYFFIYASMIQVTTKILLYIVNNCITTIK